MEEQTNTPSPKNEKDEHAKKHKGTLIGLWISIAVNVILLAAVGWLWWQFMQCLNMGYEFAGDKTSLEKQIDDLKKQLADKGATTSNSAACTNTPVSQTLKDNIRDAISSDNTAALEGYMASSLKVIIAASEFGETRTPTQAISDLSYIHDSSGWNFALSTATVNSYLAGPYGTGSPGGVNYFDSSTFFGKASDDKLVAFNFDACGKINQVFMAVNVDLLL